MIVITRPNHDSTTDYLYFWSEEIIKEANKRLQKIVDLSKGRSNTKEFASVVKKIRPSLIVFNGHGNASRITGHNNEPLVIADKNEHLLNKTIVYARACKAALKLGKDAIKSGCYAFVGYKDDFVFIVDTNYTTRPLQDKTAKLFLEPSNHVALSIIKGHSSSEANNRSKRLFKKNIQRLMTSAASKEQSDLIPYLVWDYTNQVCLGDSQACLSKDK